MQSPLHVVEAWQDAAAAGDEEALLALSAPEIEIVGPRGSGFGHHLLRQWTSHARVSLTTLRAFVRGDVVVVAQHGVWRDPETGAVTGEADVASHFVVVAGRVTRYARHDALDDALSAAGLTHGDEAVIPR